jgi:6-pyruvoyltetrahydropterin/6-carboxytetrahydropterin synthase
MTNITRELRFFLRPHPLPNRVPNSWVGWNDGLEIAPALRLCLTVSGRVDTQTGYICNIKSLDDAMRQAINLQTAGSEAPPTRFDELLSGFASRIENVLPDGLVWLDLELKVTPQFSMKVKREMQQMICLTKQFEFSSAHRLHCNELNELENIALFGKCNNPSGHGHNYVLEITVSGSTDQSTVRLSGHEPLDATVKRLVIDRFDHKHLNADVPEFADLNPSVENIAATIWKILNGQLSPLKLQQIRVYETPKTWADYRE